jgi:prepilin-type N-terminal cleavage/methylation domain-containing protein
MRGFTTIELIVVMTVMAVLAVPRLTDRGALQERGARDQLRALLAYSRKMAITQQRDVCVLAAAGAVRAVYAPGGACAPGQPLADPAGGGALRLDLPPGVTLGGAPLVRFSARGQPVPAADRTLFVGGMALTVYRETGLAQ